MTKSNKTVDNVCLTAVRVIAILMMLKERPHTEVEISDKLKNNIELPRGLSKDSIWLYINTLKAVGCDITRPTKNNGYTYILKDHPFKLNLTEAEFKSLIEARKYVSNLSNWEISCNFDKFLNAMSSFLEDDDRKILLKYCKSHHREIDYTLKKEIIRELEYLCSKNAGVLVIYSSSSENYSEKKLIAEYLKYENGALYFWGYNIDIKEHQYLRVDRIEQIAECDLGDIEIKTITTKVKFKLYGIHAVSYHPEENEIIIDRDDKSITIESQMKNKFKLVQKVLSFGKDCEVIEPREIQEEIISKLRLMSDLYKDDI